MNQNYCSKNLQNQSQMAVNVCQTDTLYVNSDALAIGGYAGEASQGTYATAVGSCAGQYQQGIYGVALGRFAGWTQQGNDAVAIGGAAGKVVQGYACVAVGTDAGLENQQPCAVAIGANAGFRTQGNYAIAIGYQAGLQNQPPNSIILNATGGDLPSYTQSSALYIAPIRAMTSGTASSLLAYNTSTNEVQSAVNITMAGTIAAASYFSTSDARLKSNVRPVPPVLEKVKSLRPVQFDWKNDGRPDYGFIAQDFFTKMDFLQDAHNFKGEAFPKDKNGSDVFYTMEYPKITAILCKAIQELTERVESLERAK